MIQLKIQNYNTEEKETLSKAISTALLSIHCEFDETGKCKGSSCKNHKVCTDLAHAIAFLYTPTKNRK